LGTGYYNTSASYQGSGGDAGINSIPFYAYGAYTPGAFYAMGYLGYTLNLYSLDRTIAFGGLNRVATSSVNGNQLNASLESGYDFKVAQVTVTPAFTLYYSQAWVDSFTESGAGALDLKVASQSADSLQTGLGMRLSRPFQTGQTLVLPQIYAFYQHEFANNSRGLDARLAQTGTTFGFQTDSPSRDFAVVGAGLALGLRKNLTLQANYNAEVGRGGYTPMVVSAGLRYEF
jgi:outer membrane autotransporter protein